MPVSPSTSPQSSRGIVRQPQSNRGLAACLAALLAMALGPALAAAEPAKPWRLGSALDLPAWLELSGAQRTRYETLDGQFRSGRTGGDQVLALRTSLLAQVHTAPAHLLVELLDSRQYLADSGSPVDNTTVNALDVLQANLRWDAGELLPGGTNTIRVGRETLDLGNRRLVARNAYRNTINAFTGVDWLWQAQGGGSFRAFYFLPVRRLPEDAPSLLDNEIKADTQSFDQQFWGLYAEAPRLMAGIRAEAYWLRLQEEPARDSRNRHLHTPGVRIFRNPQAGHWDFEVESTFQFGTSRARAGLNLVDEEHRAHLQHGGLGYTFELPWKPRLGVRYDYISGDRNPGDADNQRFDTLFGARRFEFGPTGSYGAVSRDNLNSPEYSVSVRPHRTLDVSFSHRFLWLAEARGAWTPGGVRDVTGNSGTELGQQVEVRVRWEIRPGNLLLDTGYTRLMAGDFLRQAPNATYRGDTQYAWFEVTFLF
jgi:hypothetical protein